MELSAIIAAAGSGVRFGGPVPKQYLALGGLPLVIWSIRAFLKSPVVREVIVVFPEGNTENPPRLLSGLSGGKPLKWCAGGPTRQESVFRGLSMADAASEWVAVHDGARPFINPLLIEGVFGMAKGIGAAIPGLPVPDTVKLVDEDRLIRGTLDRKDIVLAQTPQICRRTDLMAAYAHARKSSVEATDEAGLLEAMGLPVGVFPGDPENIKITTRADLALAGAILSLRSHAS